MSGCVVVVLWRKDDILDGPWIDARGVAGDPDLGPLKPAELTYRNAPPPLAWSPVPEECFFRLAPPNFISHFDVAGYHIAGELPRWQPLAGQDIA